MLLAAKCITGHTSGWWCEWCHSDLSCTRSPQPQGSHCPRPLLDKTRGSILSYSACFQAVANRHKVPEMPCKKARSFTCLLTATPQLPWAHHWSINTWQCNLNIDGERTRFYKKQNIQHALFRKKKCTKACWGSIQRASGNCCCYYDNIQQITIGQHSCGHTVSRDVNDEMNPEEKVCLSISGSQFWEGVVVLQDILRLWIRVDHKEKLNGLLNYIFLTRASKNGQGAAVLSTTNFCQQITRCV